MGLAGEIEARDGGRYFRIDLHARNKDIAEDFARSFIQTSCLNERPATLAIIMIAGSLGIDGILKQAQAFRVRKMIRSG